MGSSLKVTDATKISRRDFPADFVFGAATSSHQIEGGAKEGGRGPSIWDTFTERRPDMIDGGVTATMAVNSYHLYKEDVKILKNLGMDAYRFSISWSRILPGGRLSAGVNKEGIDYYNNLINELLANGIEPYVTLFHWDLPQALEDHYGGFISPKIVDDFCEYAELCFWEFGDRVKYWITVNEPWSYSVMGYARGIFAPGRGSTTKEQVESHSVILRSDHYTPPGAKIVGNPGTEPYLVTHHQLLAHAAAVRLYRTKFQKGQGGKIGLANVTFWIEPLQPNSYSDVKAALRGLDFSYGWFMEPLTTGDYPESMKTLVGSRLPRFTEEQSQMLKGSHDFLGVNYYTAMYAYDTSDKPPPAFPSYDTDPQIEYTIERDGVPIGPSHNSVWLHVYPDGLRQLLVYTKKTYNPPPIYIMENGMNELKDPKVTISETRLDDFRIEYIQEHLVKILEAMREGVKVNAYFVWSLLDNFEWADGYNTRFGITYVDYNDNFARHPKNSALWYMNNFHKNLFNHSVAPARIEENNEDQVPSKRSRK